MLVFRSWNRPQNRIKAWKWGLIPCRLVLKIVLLINIDFYIILLIKFIKKTYRTAKCIYKKFIFILIYIIRGVTRNLLLRGTVKLK